MKVICPRSVISAFKISAKASYPKEDYAILLGLTNHKSLTIKGIYFPEDRKIYAEKTCMWKDISTKASWRKKAESLAAENNLEVIGDIHSHPNFSDSSPSQLDWEKSDKGWLLGIMGIYGKKINDKMSLFSSYKFWIVPEKIEEIVK